MPRWSKALLFAIVTTYAVYFAAANVVLRTHLLRGWLDTDPDKMLLDYGSAWSPYPGHVVVRDLKLRFQDTNVQFSLAIDHTSLDIDLWALTHARASFNHVRADGVVFRMRTKLDTVAGNEGRVQAFPPIEGFADPPLLKPSTEPELDDAHYNLWTIDLRDVAAHVREVWIVEYRLRGDIGLAGGFHLKPLRELWVSPAVMEAPNEAVLSLGDKELIRGGAWRLDARIDPFDPRVPRGVEYLRPVSLHVHQHGGLASLASVSQTYFPNSKFAFAEGGGPIDIDARVEHGVVQPDSRVTYSTKEAVLRGPGLTLTTDIDAAAHVVSREDHPSIVAELASAHGRMKPALDVQGLEASVDLGTNDLTAPMTITQLSAAVKSAHAPDLNAWQPLAPANTTLGGGAATVAARANYHRGELAGRVDASFDKARLTVGTFNALFSGKAGTDLQSADVTKAIVFPRMRADLHDVGIRLEDGHAENMWLRARFDKTNMTSASPFTADTDIAIESGPGEGTMKLFTRLASLPDLAADVTHGTMLDAALHVRVRPDDLALTVLHAKNGEIQARGRIHKPQETGPDGAFLLSIGPVRSGLDIRDGVVHVKPFSGTAWFDETSQKR